MLPKASRLTSAEVRAILKEGKNLRVGALSAKFRAGKGMKAAVVVKNAVAKTAVTRNRLRRRAYAALRAKMPRDVHMVVFLQKPTFNPDELAELCSRLS